MGLNPITIDDLKFFEGKQVSVYLEHWASVAADLQLSYLTKDGLDFQTIKTTSDRARGTVTKRLANYPMMVKVHVVSGADRRGQVFVACFMLAAGQVLGCLFSGYIHTGRALTWPGGIYEDSVNDPGLLRSIAGTDPAAGAEVEETVPTNARWRLNSLRVRLVTSADTGNRRPRIRIDDGDKLHFQVPSITNQPASTTRDYAWIAGQGYEADERDGLYTLGLPAKLLLFQGWKIRVEVQGMFAADNLGPPQMMVEEWIEE